MIPVQIKVKEFPMSKISENKEIKQNSVKLMYYSQNIVVGKLACSSNQTKYKSCLFVYKQPHNCSGLMARHIIH